MVEEVQKRQRVNEGSFSSTVTSKVKKAAWNSVTERVDAVSTSQRTAGEVKQVDRLQVCHEEKTGKEE